MKYVGVAMDFALLDDDLYVDIFAATLGDWKSGLSVDDPRTHAFVNDYQHCRFHAS